MFLEANIIETCKIYTQKHEHQTNDVNIKNTKHDHQANEQFSKTEHVLELAQVAQNQKTSNRPAAPPLALGPGAAR